MSTTENEVAAPAVVPAPRRPGSLLATHARALLVTVATLAAAASALTYQLAEGF